MPGPLATTRGPTRKPSLIESRRSTGQERREPTSRTVVKPASSVLRALSTAAKALVNGRVLELVDLVEAIGPAAQVRVAIDQARQHDGVRQVDRWSRRRGSTLPSAGPTALIRSPFDDDHHVAAIRRRVVPSNSRPAFTTTLRGASAATESLEAQPVSRARIAMQVYFKIVLLAR